MSCADAFAAFDTDGSGTLSYDELKAVLVPNDGSGMLSEAVLERIFVHFDRNMDGDISIREFESMWESVGGQTTQQAARIVATHTASSSTPPPPPPTSVAVPTATLAEQSALLARSIASRQLPLRAVLTNTEHAVWPKLNQLIEGHLGFWNQQGAGSSIAPCEQLYDPDEGSCLSGWYNGVVMLLLHPDVPEAATAKIESLVTKLLEVRSPSSKTRCVHHVLLVPCAAATTTAFLALGKEEQLDGSKLCAPSGSLTPANTSALVACLPKAGQHVCALRRACVSRVLASRVPQAQAMARRGLPWMPGATSPMTSPFHGLP